jgi:hypothetical protein
LTKGIPKKAQFWLNVAFGEAILMRGVMSDEEWSCLEPFVIERGARSGRRPRNHRLVLDGIFWIARTGVAWPELRVVTKRNASLSGEPFTAERL